MTYTRSQRRAQWVSDLVQYTRLLPLGVLSLLLGRSAGRTDCGGSESLVIGALACFVLVCGVTAFSILSRKRKLGSATQTWRNTSCDNSSASWSETTVGETSRYTFGRYRLTRSSNALWSPARARRTRASSLQESCAGTPLAFGAEPPILFPSLSLLWKELPGESLGGLRAPLQGDRNGADPVVPMTSPHA
jgi:hypothetical protein